MDQNAYVGANPNIRMDQHIELGRMVVEAFGRCDELQGNIANVKNKDGGNGAFNLDFVDVEVDHERTEVKMYKEAQTPLYEGCFNSQLPSILLLLSLVSTHGVSNTFVDELFTLLWVDLFPKDNTFPKSLY